MMMMTTMPHIQTVLIAILLAMVGVSTASTSSFVVRNGTKLLLDSEEFRIVGANCYWLGLDENVPPGVVNYPTSFRIRDALEVWFASSPLLSTSLFPSLY